MITSKQRAKLRALAQKIEPIIYIGKENITPNLLAQVDDALEARELIKGSVQQNCELTAREASIQLCEKMNAEGVSILGRKFVIYRPSKENKKIEL